MCKLSIHFPDKLHFKYTLDMLLIDGGWLKWEGNKNVEKAMWQERERKRGNLMNEQHLEGSFTEERQCPQRVKATRQGWHFIYVRTNPRWAWASSVGAWQFWKAISHAVQSNVGSQITVF